MRRCCRGVAKGIAVSSAMDGGGRRYAVWELQRHKGGALCADSAVLSSATLCLEGATDTIQGKGIKGLNKSHREVLQSMDHNSPELLALGRCCLEWVVVSFGTVTPVKAVMRPQREGGNVRGKEMFLHIPSRKVFVLPQSFFLCRFAWNGVLSLSMSTAAYPLSPQEQRPCQNNTRGGGGRPGPVLVCDPPPPSAPLPGDPKNVLLRWVRRIFQVGRVQPNPPPHARF